MKFKTLCKLAANKVLVSVVMYLGLVFVGTPIVQAFVTANSNITWLSKIGYWIVGTPVDPTLSTYYLLSVVAVIGYFSYTVGSALVSYITGIFGLGLTADEVNPLSGQVINENAA